MKGASRDDAWLVIRGERSELVLTREIDIPKLPAELHRGEREVIALAMQRNAVAARIDTLRPLLLDLLERGFPLGDRLVHQALIVAGEPPESS